MELLLGSVVAVVIFALGFFLCFFVLAKGREQDLRVIDNLNTLLNQQYMAMKMNLPILPTKMGFTPPPSITSPIIEDQGEDPLRG